MTRRTTNVRTARTVADTLRAWDDAALAELVTARPDLVRPAPADLGQLAARAAGRGSVSMALDRLDTAHLAVVEVLALLDAPVGIADVQRVVHARPGAVVDVVVRLRALALVWGDDNDLRLVRSGHDVVGPTPAGLGPGLVTLLTATAPARVRAIAEDLHLEPTGDPVGTAERIAAAYSDPAWAGTRIEEATAAGGDDVPAILRRLAPGPPAGRLGRLPVDVRVATATGALEQLLARALLVPVDTGTVTLPREVGLLLRGGRTTVEPVDVAPDGDGRDVGGALADRTGAGAADASVRRVELVLETWGATPPAVLRSGGVGVREVRAVAAELGVGEDEAGFLLEVCRAAGLLAVGDDPGLDEVWLPTDAFDRWQDQPAAKRWGRLAAAWLTTPRATVLVGGRDDRDRPVNPLTPDLERGNAGAVRRAALQVLAAHGAGLAVAPDQVVASVAWARPRRVPLRDAVVRRTLVEAGWLGVTALGALTSAGRALLDEPAEPVEPAYGESAAAVLAPLLPDPVDHVLLQADLTAVAPGPLQPVVAHGLALLADVESRGGATVYRFSGDSVRRALDAGWPASEVHAFLQTHSRTPVPQPLAYLVDDAARRHGRLRVGGAGVYVRCDDPTELDTLMADVSLASLDLHRLAPTVAVSDQPADVVLARLRRAHRSPLLEGADGRAIGVEAESRRARPARAPITDVLALGAAQAVRVVAAMRAGERAHAARPRGRRVSGPTRLVDELRTAVEGGRTVWLAYLDETGTVSERVVDPVDVDGGRLTAYDHRSARNRSFALHRISHVAAAG